MVNITAFISLLKLNSTIDQPQKLDSAFLGRSSSHSQYTNQLIYILRMCATRITWI